MPNRTDMSAPEPDRAGSGLPPAELRKRKREGVIVALSLLAILFLTSAEIHLSRLNSEVPMGSNITIFGIINVIILLIILLVYLVFRNIAKLLLERRKNAPGSKLRTKLVLAFVTLSLVPTMLLFFVSAGFITNSIQNWFNKQVENSLNESMEVAQTYYKNSAANALYYGEQISAAIKERKLLNEENVVGVIVVNYYVPYSLVAKLEEITASYHEFRQLKIMKNPITTGYILTLFLITMVIAFLAIWFGVYLALSLIHISE